jgi:hypothetical protein
MAFLDFVAAGVMVLSAALLVISISSYRRTGNAKLLFTVGAFVVFFLVGVGLFAYEFTPDADPAGALAAIGLLNLLVLALLYFATLKR